MTENNTESKGFPDILPVVHAYRQVRSFLREVGVRKGKPLGAVGVSSISERYPDIARVVVDEYRGVLDRQLIGEMVIRDLTDKSPGRIHDEEVRRVAKDKYFVVRLPEKKEEENHHRVVVCSLHGKRVTDELIENWFLRRAFPDRDMGVLRDIRRRYDMQNVAKRFHKIEGYPDREPARLINALRMKKESKTDDLALALGRLLSTPVILYRHSRMKADPNRDLDFLSPRGALDNKHPTQELPRRARSAMMFSLEDEALPNVVEIDVDGRVKNPVMVLLPHGMPDRKHAAIILGGGSSVDQIISPKVIDWFAKELTKEMNARSLRIDGDVAPLVAIHRDKQASDRDENGGNEKKNVAEVYKMSEEGDVNVVEEEIDGKRISGAGLGYGALRGKYGPGVQFLQMEMALSLRNDEQGFEIFQSCVEMVLRRFSEQFPDIQSLGEE